MVRSVVCVEGDVGVRIELPVLLSPKWMSERDFGLKRPAVGTEVENLVGVVSAGRCGDGEAPTQGCSGSVVLELRYGESRTALEQHSHLVAGVTGTRRGTLDGCSTDRATESGNGNSSLQPHQATKKAKVACVTDGSLVEVEICARDD